jgi:hypothetical protein
MVMAGFSGVRLGKNVTENAWTDVVTTAGE